MAITYQRSQVPIFPLVYLKPNRFSRFSRYLKEVKAGGRLLPSFEKNVRVWQPLAKSRSITS